jgi:hypothetical protein
LGGIVREWPCHVTSEERGPTRVSPSSLIVPASAFHRSQCSRCAAERPKKPTDKESAISLSVAALLRSMAFCGFRVRVMTHYGTLNKTGRACIWRRGQFFKKRRLFATPTREKRAIFVTSPRRSRCTAGAVSASYVESRAAHHGPVVGRRPAPIVATRASCLMHTPNRRTPDGIKGMEGGVMGAIGALRLRSTMR